MSAGGAGVVADADPPDADGSNYRDNGCGDIVLTSDSATAAGRRILPVDWRRVRRRAAHNEPESVRRIGQGIVNGVAPASDDVACSLACGADEFNGLTYVDMTTQDANVPGCPAIRVGRCC